MPCRAIPFVGKNLQVIQSACCGKPAAWHVMDPFL